MSLEWGKKEKKKGSEFSQKGEKKKEVEALTHTNTYSHTHIHKRAKKQAQHRYLVLKWERDAREARKSLH